MARIFLLIVLASFAQIAVAEEKVTKDATKSAPVNPEENKERIEKLGEGFGKFVDVAGPKIDALENEVKKLKERVDALESPKAVESDEKKAEKLSREKDSSSPKESSSPKRDLPGGDDL